MPFVMSNKIFFVLSIKFLTLSHFYAAPLGFGASLAEPRASRITMAGEFIKSFLGSAKKMADSLQLFQAMGDSASALLETIREVPEYVRSWKESFSRHGARMAFSVVKSARSEERRVGKECLRLCRSRWSPYH